MSYRIPPSPSDPRYLLYYKLDSITDAIKEMTNQLKITNQLKWIEVSAYLESLGLRELSQETLLKKQMELFS